MKRHNFLARVVGLACAPFGLAAASPSRKPLAFAMVTSVETKLLDEPHCIDKDGGFLVSPEFAGVIAGSSFVCISRRVTGRSGLSLEDVMRKRGVIA